MRARFDAHAVLEDAVELLVQRGSMAGDVAQAVVRVAERLVCGQPAGTHSGDDAACVREWVLQCNAFGLDAAGEDAGAAVDASIVESTRAKMSTVTKQVMRALPTLFVRVSRRAVAAWSAPDGAYATALWQLAGLIEVLQAHRERRTSAGGRDLDERALWSCVGRVRVDVMRRLVSLSHAHAPAAGGSGGGRVVVADALLLAGNGLPGFDAALVWALISGSSDAQLAARVAGSRVRDIRADLAQFTRILPTDAAAGAGADAGDTGLDAGDDDDEDDDDDDDDAYEEDEEIVYEETVDERVSEARIAREDARRRAAREADAASVRHTAGMSVRYACAVEVAITLFRCSIRNRREHDAGFIATSPEYRELLDGLLVHSMCGAVHGFHAYADTETACAMHDCVANTAPDLASAVVSFGAHALVHVASQAAALSVIGEAGRLFEAAYHSVTRLGHVDGALPAHAVRTATLDSGLAHAYTLVSHVGPSAYTYGVPVAPTGQFVNATNVALTLHQFGYGRARGAGASAGGVRSVSDAVKSGHLKWCWETVCALYVRTDMVAVPSRTRSRFTEIVRSILSASSVEPVDAETRGMLHGIVSCVDTRYTEMMRFGVLHALFGVPVAFVRIVECLRRDYMERRVSDNAVRQALSTLLNLYPRSSSVFAELTTLLALRGRVVIHPAPAYAHAQYVARRIAADVDASGIRVSALLVPPTDRVRVTSSGRVTVSTAVQGTAKCGHEHSTGAGPVSCPYLGMPAVKSTRAAPRHAMYGDAPLPGVRRLRSPFQITLTEYLLPPQEVPYLASAEPGTEAPDRQTIAFEDRVEPGMAVIYVRDVGVYTYAPCTGRLVSTRAVAYVSEYVDPEHVRSDGSVAVLSAASMVTGFMCAAAQAAAGRPLAVRALAYAAAVSRAGAAVPCPVCLRFKLTVRGSRWETTIPFTRFPRSLVPEFDAHTGQFSVHRISSEGGDARAVVHEEDERLVGPVACRVCAGCTYASRPLVQSLSMDGSVPVDWGALQQRMMEPSRGGAGRRATFDRHAERHNVSQYFNNTR